MSDCNLPIAIITHFFNEQCTFWARCMWNAFLNHVAMHKHMAPQNHKAGMTDCTHITTLTQCLLQAVYYSISTAANINNWIVGLCATELDCQCTVTVLHAMHASVILSVWITSLLYDNFNWPLLFQNPIFMFTGITHRCHEGLQASFLRRRVGRKQTKQYIKRTVM